MFNFLQKTCVVFLLLCASQWCFAQDETLRDPTQPLGHRGQYHAAPQKLLRLQSLLVSGSRKVAYINGQQVREQDRLNDSEGTRVVGIDADGVTLQQGERRWRLTLNKVVVRQ